MLETTTLSLFRSLAANCLPPPTRTGPPVATDSQWHSCLEELSRHRLTEHVFVALRDSGHLSLVPRETQLGMATQFLRTQSANGRLIGATSRMLTAMAARDIQPIVLKGIAMADFFYPEPGARPMGDIDLLIALEEMDEALAALGSVGFFWRPDIDGGDAVYLADDSGLLCDLHYRMRLFEGKEREDLTIEVQPRRLDVPKMRLLEPHAMVVHLVVHMDGHQDETGSLLGWIVDLALVLRAWGARLHPDRIRELMPAGRPAVLFARILKLLSTELGQELPESLVDLARDAVPLPLAQVLRQRRVRPWGVPGLRGWGRLGAHTFGIPLKHNYPALHRGDLFGMVGDTVRDTRSYGRVRSRNNRPHQVGPDR